jgi:hypothetical protein
MFGSVFYVIQKFVNFLLVLEWKAEPKAEAELFRD